MSDEKNDIGSTITAVTATAGAILALIETLKRVGTLPNIPFPTLGGKVFWNNIAEKDGWKVQKNMFTSHCRVLDPNDVRVAWGFSEEALLAELKKLAGNNS